MRAIIEARRTGGNAAFRRWGPLLGALLLALTLKAGLLAAGVVPFNADEAVVALMARHILQGARPVFFYGQVYLGSLDAWLVAGAFALFGQSVLAIRVVQAALFGGTLITTYWLGLEIYGRRWIAAAAAAFLAVPTVLVTLYTTASLGGYGETLLIGNLLLLLAVRLAQPAAHWSAWLAFGLLGGLGFWGFPLILVYLMPAGIYSLWLGRRSLPHGLLGLAGFVAGAAPWFSFSLREGAATIAELSGSAIAGASAANPIVALIEHAFNFALLGLTVIFGLRPPWSAHFLALPLAPYALAVYSGLIVFVARRLRSGPGTGQPGAGRWLLAGCVGALIAGFVLTPFGADPSGRYFLPLSVPLALFLAEMLNWLRLRRRRRRSAWRTWFGNSLALGVIAFNFWGTIQSAADFPPGITTQFDVVAQVDQRFLPELVDFLRARGETRGYSNYWVEFPLAFLSNEELLYEARLPYHLDFRYTPRDSRYGPYSRAVDASPRVAYITTRHPELDRRLREGLRALGVAFEEEQIGDFHIFFGLSRKVVPEELGLGVLCCPE